MKPVFFLRHFNDVDHISPVIWRCLKQGDVVTAVLLNSNYPGEQDPRIEYLCGYDGFNLTTAHEFLRLPLGDGMFRLADGDGKAPENTVYRVLRRALQRSGMGKHLAARALRAVEARVCVFEWGPPRRTSHMEFFGGARLAGVPTVSLPHGLNIYTNIDVNPTRTDRVKAGEQTMASRNEYDAYVSQSEYHREQDIRLGVDPETYHLLGSARYDPNWQSINESLYEPYDAAGDTDSRLRVVFMLPHWEYNVDKEQTLRLVSDLADQDWVYLIVKEHTRGDSLPEVLDTRLVNDTQAEIIADTASVSLIQWSTAVVNFGSSIGIEALLQDKHHVNPSYLHRNTTIFDETGAEYGPESNEKTVEILKNIHHGNLDPVGEEAKNDLYKTVIYGGREEHDVLEAYRGLIRRISES